MKINYYLEKILGLYWFLYSIIWLIDLFRYSPYTTKFNKCKICKSTIHQPGSTYCQGLYSKKTCEFIRLKFWIYLGCSYKLGICAMCGVKILQTKNYRQSSV